MRIHGSKFLLPRHPLSNIEIPKYLHYEPRFNSAFSRNNLPRIKDGTYVINVDNKKSDGTHWVSLFIVTNPTLFFDSFEIKYIPQEVLNKIKDKSITHDIFRIQDNESIMCGVSCIAFIEYMPAGINVLHYMNLFSPNHYKKNDKIIYKYFKDIYVNSRV